MATGIVSIAAHFCIESTLAKVLLGLNIALYFTLTGLTLLRVATAPHRVGGDFRPHASAPGFFTIVAGSSVLGSQLVLLAEAPRAALVLWCLSIGLWLTFTYAFFTVMTISQNKPRLEEGMNGTWMLIVVSTQAISVLGTSLASHSPDVSSLILGFTTVMFLLGCIFYIVLFSLTLYRFLFYPFDPVRLTPPYWINMGAVAITTLSGSSLILHSPEWPFLVELLPFLKGFTLLFWSTSSWWIPLIVVLGIWRHIVHKVPIRYDVQYWSVVFPIGMYSVATSRMVDALGFDELSILADIAGYIAFIAWGLTFSGLLRHLGRDEPYAH